MRTLIRRDLRQFAILPMMLAVSTASMAGIVCPQHYDPVCGADGKTYSNSCMAHQANQRVLHAGACKTAAPALPGKSPSAPVQGKLNTFESQNDALMWRALLSTKKATAQKALTELRHTQRPGRLSKTEYRLIDRVIRDMQKSPQQGLRQWKRVANVMAKNGRSAAVIDQVANWTVKTVYLGGDAHALANALKTCNDYKSELRTVIAELRDVMTDTDWSKTTLVEVYAFKRAVDCNTAVNVDKQLQAYKVNREQLAALIETQENYLSTLSDMTQMLQLQLQQAMQTQSQVMQLMSNILKSMHDTAKAIIQNLR